MGYTHKGSITNFWPDDTENEIYIEDTGNISLQDIIDIINKEWGDVNIDDIYIGSEKIHTYCITYDLYDPSDYTNFITITKDK